ncbi:hypothetical protein D3C86_1757780 [compost metagenome]
MPPISFKSCMTYRPLGFRSAKWGTRRRICSKSSNVKSTPTEWAMASKCRNAFVEPPKAITTVIAFSNAFFVIMSLGYISCSSSDITCLPAATHSAALSGEMAGVEEEPGRLMPIASAAAAIVLAVYIPPQDPGPGQTLHSTLWSCSSVIFPS